MFDVFWITISSFKQQSAKFWVCLEQFIYNIWKLCWWTMICCIWCLRLLDRFGEIKIWSYRTYRLLLTNFKHTKVHFFWIFTACLDYFILKVYGWTLIGSIWCLGLLDRFGEIKVWSYRTYGLILTNFKHTKLHFFGSLQHVWTTSS